MICNRCKKNKSLQEFWKRYKTCIECQKEKRRQASQASQVAVEVSETAVESPEASTVIITPDVVGLSSTPIGALIVESAVRLNRHRIDGRGMREFQAQAQAYADSHIDSAQVMRFVANLEVSMDPTRSGDLRDAATAELNKLRGD